MLHGTVCDALAESWVMYFFTNNLLNVIIKLQLQLTRSLAHSNF